MMTTTIEHHQNMGSKNSQEKKTPSDTTSTTIQVKFDAYEEKQLIELAKKLNVTKSRVVQECIKRVIHRYGHLLKDDTV